MTDDRYRAGPRRRKELARADKVLPGVWRLRLPLPWPGVPHGNAWAVAAGDGVVLFDTGMDQPGALGQLELALGQAGLRLEHVRLLVCTHAHSDHYGLAGPIIDASGCELWMHPNDEHMRKLVEDPDAQMNRRLEVALHSGVPLESVEAAREARTGTGSGVTRLVEPDRHLLPGVEVQTDLGRWQVHETPGHAPSHVILHQPERRLMISGDHIIGRVSLYYDFGWTPDPAGEFLASLDTVEGLPTDLILPGHGKPVRDLPGAGPGQPRGRARADGARARRHRRRRADAVRDRAEAAADRGPEPDAGELGPGRDAGLPAPPRGRGRGRRGSRARTPSAGELT